MSPRPPPPPPAPAPAGLTAPLRAAIAGRVVALFNDRARGETPIVPSDDALFPPGAVVRRVHGDVFAMLAGGVAGLLLQMLEPRVLAGVWDHSNFRTDMHGRLRRTARFIALTTYGARAEAVAAIARVNAIHEQVQGALPDGTPYHARDPALLAWVHVTETTSFLAGWLRYAEPRMSLADQDRYFAEMAEIAERLGADPIPRSRAAAGALIQAMRPGLAADERTRTVARLVLGQAAPSAVEAPMQRLALQAGVDLLPRWARDLHGFRAGPLAPLTRIGGHAIARTLRWAFEPRR